MVRGAISNSPSLGGSSPRVMRRPSRSKVRTVLGALWRMAWNTSAIGRLSQSSGSPFSRSRLSTGALTTTSRRSRLIMKMPSRLDLISACSRLLSAAIS